MATNSGVVGPGNLGIHFLDRTHTGSQFWVKGLGVYSRLLALISNLPCFPGASAGTPFLKGISPGLVLQFPGPPGLGRPKGPIRPSTIWRSNLGHSERLGPKYRNSKNLTHFPRVWDFLGNRPCAFGMVCYFGPINPLWKNGLLGLGTFGIKLGNSYLAFGFLKKFL